MPFTDKVRDEALVLAARHCCVCHRRRGVNIEVHHIKPEAESNDNTLKNAIVLCFDCHSDAGHFNPKHPRGTKLSQRELWKHRDAWHKIVKENKIPSIESKNFFRFRYHLVKNFEQFSKIQKGELPQIWGESSLYFSDGIGRFHKQITKLHKETHRRCDLYLQSYPKHQSYLESNSEARELRRDELESFPIYESTRPLTDLDLVAITQKDPITSHIIAEGGEPSDFAIPMGHFCPCSGCYLEEIIIRPIWPIYLEIVNISDKPYSVPKIKGWFSSQNRFSASRVQDLELTDADIEVSNMEIKPGESVFFPIMTVLGPFTGDLDDHIFSSTAVDRELGCDVQNSVNGHGDLNHCRILGDSIWPYKIFGSENNEEFVQEIHECDFKRFFTLDRDYMCGSCPFLFGVTKDGNREFIREILVTGEDRITEEEIILAKDFTSFEIAELQDERTELLEIQLNGETLLEKTTLQKGESVSFEVKSTDKRFLKMKGGFFPLNPGLEQYENSINKNQIVRKWLRDT